jgi:transcriptional regulator with GAF, ATPase, and Fis domain
MERVETIAPFDVTVVILGESGSGQEWIARSIHQLSSRHDELFVRLDCSAFPHGQLERKLFGYHKDGISGVRSWKVGRLELAHMGTLFLEEIGAMPIDMQARLLGALQEKEIGPYRGHKGSALDIRLLAATTRDLNKMVKAGEFNSDLYHHLMTFPIILPPLRTITADIPQLVNYFVKKHARRLNKQIDTIPEETMVALCAAEWPGNLRELENFIERAVIVSPGSTLFAPLAELESFHDDTLYAAERRHILRVLKDTKGIIGGPRGAAEKLGLKRTTLNSKLKKLNIERMNGQMAPFSR